MKRRMDLCMNKRRTRRRGTCQDILCSPLNCSRLKGKATRNLNNLYLNGKTLKVSFFFFFSLSFCIHPHKLVNHHPPLNTSASQQSQETKDANTKNPITKAKRHNIQEWNHSLSSRCLPQAISIWPASQPSRTHRISRRSSKTRTSPLPLPWSSPTL